MAAFREVVKARPGAAEAHNNLGLALLQVGDADTRDHGVSDGAALEAGRCGLSDESGHRVHAENGFRCGGGGI